MRYPVFILAALAFIAIFTMPALAAVDNEPVARVAALRDQAIATSVTGEKRLLKVRGPLFQGDIIETGDKARLQLLFSDNTIISLGRSTTFIINEYIWQPDKQEGKLHSEVKEGIFRVMGGKITKTSPQQFTTKTPAATIGIRGSMYAGLVSGQNLSVVFQGGLGIVVANAHGSIEILKPGYGTHVNADEPPPPATPFSGDELDAFTSGLTDPDGDGEEGTTDNGSGAGSNGDDDTVWDDTEQPADAPLDPAIIDTPELPPPSDTNPPLETVGAWTPPTDGITLFRGTIGGVATRFDDGGQEIIDEQTDIYANWHNNKILGIAYDDTQEGGTPVFFFGDINNGSVTNIKVFGGTDNRTSSSSPFYQEPFLDDLSTVEGSGSGGFLGTDIATFYFQGSGYDYAIEPVDQPALSSWDVQGVGQEITTSAAPKGTATWQGYVVGISEDMNNIDFNRRLLTGDITLAINKDTGNINGVIDAESGAFAMNNITVGGTYGSAFIQDNLFAAILGGGSVAMKEHGNYLVTGPQNEQFMEYATWGYWEVAYSEGASQYHNHVPGAMWVAGQPTSTTDMAALAGNNVVGNYSGKVLASKVDTTAITQVSEVGGTINLNVNFANMGSTGAISGNMALDGNSFQVEGAGTAGNPSFNASLFAGSFFGDINGTLFGPSAGSVGGNFQIENGTVTYQGIYGGNR